ncbi:MAG: CpaF family protein, partial [Lachnospiraceae bacterium]|nr:CpaF family protein [Lachnospiraceae bacterium]
MRQRREELRVRLTEFVLAAIDGSRELSDDELRDLIEQSIRAHTKELALSVQERLTGRRDVFHALRGLDVLQDMMDDPEITEI